MSPEIVRLAHVWLRAEHFEGQARDAELEQSDGWRDRAAAIRAQAAGRVWTPDELAHATDRVWAVMRGDVRWSETSMGDRAIWKGRMRNLEMLSRPNQTQLSRSRGDTSPIGSRIAPDHADDVDPDPYPRHNPLQRGPRLHGYRERLWWNYYDTMTIGPSTPYQRMFGNANVGNMFRSNLQVAGQMESDCSFVMLAWYVAFDRLDALAWAAGNVVCEVVIGSKPMSPRMFARDLFMAVVPERPVILPVRQCFSVTVDANVAWWPDELEPFDMTFHIEGLKTRSVNW